jgi:hypothetical protein
VLRVSVREFVSLCSAKGNVHVPYCGRPALQYFSTLSQKMIRFLGEKVIEYEMCVLIFSITFV